MNGVGPRLEPDAYAGRPGMADLVQSLVPPGSLLRIDATGGEMQSCKALPQTPAP